METTTIIASPGIGIDVGKRELVTCVRRLNGVTEPPATFTNSSIGLKKFVVHLSECGVEKSTPIVLESTGPYHWPAARYLADNGYLAKVINPLHTKHIARYSIRKRKTDKIDAAQLAFLASQQYGYTFVETKDIAQKKALILLCLKNDGYLFLTILPNMTYPPKYVDRDITGPPKLVQRFCVVQ